MVRTLWMLVYVVAFLLIGWGNAWAGDSNLQTGGKLVLSKTTAFDGEKIDVTVPVRNSGSDETRNSPTGSAVQHYVNVYISRGPGDVRSVGGSTRVLVPSLKANTTTNVKVTVTVPKGWPVGTSWVHALVDSYQNRVRNETDENDNYSFTYGHSTTINIVNKRSNLRTSGALVSTKTKNLLEGESFSVDIPVENSGDEETWNTSSNPRSFYVALYLGREPGSLTGAKQLVQVVTATLLAGTKRTVRVTGKIPTGWPAGTSYLHAVVDSYGNYVRNESDETDNYSYTYGHSIGVTIGRIRSNLKTKSAITISKAKPVEGEKVTISIPVENIGADETRNNLGITSPTTRFQVQVWLCPRPGTTAGGKSLGSVWVNSLKSGASSSGTIAATIPVGTNPGQYWLHALVDSYSNYVKNETNDSDNYSYTYGHSITVDVQRARSNLRTGGAIVVSKTNPILGEQISFKVKALNSGTHETRNSVSGTARSFYVDFYLSRYPGSLSGAKHLGRQLTNSLPPSQQREVTVFGTIPSNWATGRSYIHAVVDGYQNYVRNESDEEDNVSYWYNHSTAVDVGGSNSPISAFWADLRTNTAVKVSKSQLTEGEQVTLEVAVRNAGNGETLNKIAGQSTNLSVRFYISRLPNTLDTATTLGTVSLPSMKPGDIKTAIFQATIPTGWQEGTSYIHVLVDSANNVGNELIPSNNRSYRNGHSTPVTIGYAFSNLRLSGKMVPCQSKVTVGEQICVTVPIGNFGPASTNSKFASTPANHTTRLYISQYPNSLMNAVQLTQVTHSPLGPGGRIAPKIYATLPATWYSGEAYLHAVVDVSDTVKNESNEGDNDSATTGFSAKIDVTTLFSNVKTGGAIQSDKTTYEVGEKVRLSLSVQNNGSDRTLNAISGSPTNFNVQFYLSSRPNTLEGALSLGTVTTATINSGSSRVVNHEFSVPTSWLPGSAYIHAIVDVANNVKNESNEGDNASIRYAHSSKVTITRGYSNLYTNSSLTLSNTSPEQGQYVRVVVPVKNNGNAETLNGFGGIPTASRVDIYISTRPNSILGGTKLGSATLKPMGPGAVESVEATVQIPTNYQVGGAYIHAFIDAADAVKNESNEGDNFSHMRSHSRSINVAQATTGSSTNGLSNLKTRSNITLSQTVVGDGESVFVNVPIHNNGNFITANKVNGSATSFYVRVYLSRSATSITGATQLGSKVYGALAGKSNMDASFQVTIPQNWAQGQSYIHSFVDAYQNRVRNESNENDNYSYQTSNSAAIRVEHRRSNLRTNGALTVDRSSVLDSDTVKVTIPIINNGTDWTRNSSNNITTFYVDLYLTRKPGTLDGGTRLNRILVQGMASQDKLSVQLTGTIPKGWAPGTSYLHAVVDAYSNRVRNESNEDDNYSYVYNHSATITVNNRRSNLRTADVIKPSQTTVKDADYINIQVPIINNGNETTLTAVGGSPQTHYVYVYISKTPGTLTGAKSLGGVYVASLKAGERATATVRVQIPSGWATGPSYIHALVDGYQNRIRNESDETDNYSYSYGHSATITVTRRRSNLRTTSAVTLSHSTRNDGEYVTVTVPIINNGDDATRNGVNGSLRSFYVGVYLAPRAGDLTGAKLLKNQLMPALQPGERANAQLNVQIPVGTIPARWYIHAYVDYYSNYVKNESDENDNVSYSYGHSAILNTNQIRSNLKTAGKLTSNSTTYSSGSAVIVTVPIENAGTAPTLNAVAGTPRTFYVAAYISRHPASLSGAYRLNRKITTKALNPGEKLSVQINGNIPTSSTWKTGGTIYIHAFVDEYQNYVKNESDDTDNYSYSYSHSLTVTLQGTPGTTPKWSNLTGTALIRSDRQVAYEGENVTLSYPIKNDGQEATLNKLNGTGVNFNVQFYIAPNADNLIGAVSLGTTSIYSMNAGANETAVLQAQIPAAWPSGKSYIHAIIDSGNKVGNETNRSDNISYFNKHSITINVGSRASNLRTHVGLVARPLNVNLGDKVTVDVSVLNNGDDITKNAYNGRAANFSVDLYLSQSSNGLTSAVKLKTVSFAALNSNSNATVQVEVTIPTTWSTQTAYIHALVDPSNGIKNESNEGDNQSWQYGHSATLQLSTQRSNLRTEKSITLSTQTAAHNDLVTATIYLENNGTDTTRDGINGNPARHTVTLYLARYANGLQESVKVGTANYNALGQGAKANNTISFRVPTTWPVGTAYLHAVVDSSNTVKNESNEGDNNSFQRSHSAILQVGQTFSNVTTSAKVTSSVASPNAGSFIYVTVKVTNNGKAETRTGLGGSATGSTVYLWLSQFVGNTNATRLGTFNINSLAPGATQTASFWVQIPSTWAPGSAYLHTQVDATNTVKNESNEGDNWSYINNHSLAIQVNKAGGNPGTSGTSNLRTNKIIAIDKANPVDGDKVNVTVYIQNNGTAITSSSVGGNGTTYYVDLYLSQNATNVTGATRLSRVLLQPLAGGGTATVPFQVIIPAGWTAGAAYLHAGLDVYTNRIKNESNENDNYSYSYQHSLKINVGQKRSNLRVSANIAPSKTSLSVGEYFDVRVTVENNGTETTLNKVGGTPTTHYIYLYLGTLATSTSSSSNLGGVYLQPLRPGEKVTHRFQVRVPTNWTATTGYLHALVDGYQNRIRNESNENDNYSYQTGHSTKVTIGQKKSNMRTGGELVVDNKTPSDNTYINVTVPVLNNGADISRSGIAGSPQSYYVYLYISTSKNAYTGTGTKYLGNSLLPALAGGGTATTRIRVLIPKSWPTGTSYIHAFVDGYGNRIRNESNENDNLSYVYNHSATITVQNARSNLKTSASIYVSNSAPNGGEYVDINVPIENNGTQETLSDIGGTPRTHYVYVYMAPNPSDLTGSSRLGGMYVQSLKAGEKTIAQMLLRLPTNKAAGKYYIHAFVDGYTNRIKNESNENDNYSYTYSHSATIYLGQKRSNLRTQGPLKISANQVKSGQQIAVTVPVINAGSDTTKNTISGTPTGHTVRIYIGRNANNLTGASNVGNFTVGTLAPGGTASQTVNVTVPSSFNGIYFVHAHVDVSNAVRNEADESDNYSFRLGHSQQLGVNQLRSNLRTNGSLSVNNKSPQEGALITVTVPVKNDDIDTTRSSIGGNTVPFDTWVYISSSPSSLAGAALVGKHTGTAALAANGTVNVVVNGQLPGRWVGTRYLHAVVNPSGSRRVKNERFTNDNASGALGHSIPITIGSSRSNVQFENKIQLSTSQAAPGASINATIKLKNSGNDLTRTSSGGSPQKVQVRLYMTTNAFSRQGATLLTTINTTVSLGAGQSTTIQGTFTVPSVLQPNYYVHGYIIPAGNEDVVFDNESFQTNHSAQLKILATPLADLVYDGRLSPSSTVPYAGQAITVDVPLKNSGQAPTRKGLTGATTGFDVTVYLGANATNRTGATQVGKATLSAGLAAGGVSTARVSVVIPAGATVGQAYLHAVIDVANDVGNESDRNNNESATTGNSVAINITAATQTKRSDVKFDSKLWASTTTPYPGQSVSVNVGVENGGNDDTRTKVGGTTTGFKVGLYLSKYSNSLLNAARVGTATLNNALASAQKTLVSSTISIPTNVSAGTWYLHARADVDGQVGNESNRINNDSWASNHSLVLTIVTSQKRADLDIQGSLAVSTLQPYAGQAITVQATIRNAGNDTTRDKVGGNARGFTVAVYIGTKADGSGLIQQIGTFTVNASVVSTATVNVTVNATIPGTWGNASSFIHLVADPGRVIGNEGNFRNNASYNTNQSVAITVTTASSNKRSNLNIKDAIKVTGTPYAGAFVTLEAIVQNTGNDASRDSIGGNKTDFFATIYLSSSATSVANATSWKDVKVTALDANQNQSIKEVLRIPAGLQPGTYWAHIVVDEKKAINNESNRLDNFDVTKSFKMVIGGIDDKDKDGVKSDKDCDDNDKTVYPGATEVCDGKDNNCDSQVDNGQNLCSGGATCVNGICVSNCNPACGSGFQCRNNQCVENNCYGLGCPTGKVCLNSACVDNPCSGITCNSGEYCRGGKCIKTCSGVTCPSGETCKEGTCSKDACVGVSCPTGQYCDQGTCKPSQCGGVVCTNGRICQPSTGKCIDDPCAYMTCPSGQYCRSGSCFNDPCQGRCKSNETCWGGGFCVPNNCYFSGCPTGQKCIGGTCVQDRCANKTCATGEFCRNGNCIKSCASVTCGTGQICQDGKCVTNSCAGVSCPSGETCLSGKCVKDPCTKVACGIGQRCDVATGTCVADPCYVVTCPQGQVCQNGSCFQSSCKNSCKAGYVCFSGSCVENSCYYFGCSQGYICVQGRCVTNPCGNKQCNAGEYCYQGQCYKSCAAVTCPSGERCVQGQCLKDPCSGVSCKQDEICINGTCASNPCVKTTCPKGRYCDPATGSCVYDPCSNITCPSPTQYCSNGTCYAYQCPTSCPQGFVCYKGACRANNCYTYGCPSGQYCSAGACKVNPCNNITCPSGEFCRAGSCYKSCAGVQCSAGERCEDGSCAKDPCYQKQCAQGEVCVAGNCVTNKCKSTYCGVGRVCNPSTGNCEDSACNGVACPSGQICRRGQCITSPCQPACPNDKVCEGNSCVVPDCYTFGCAAGEVCQSGVCVVDLCANKTCQSGEFCRNGQCVKTCAGVTCSAGEICEDGSCVKDPCDGVQCNTGNQICHKGTCIDDKCKNVNCKKGQICDKPTGSCIDDPCQYVKCTTPDASCRNGVCYGDRCDPACKQGEKCKAGVCLEDNCYTNGCQNDQICLNAKCVDNNCKDKQCGPREFCRDGNCISSCAQVQCSADEVCRDGKCLKDPCAGVSCKDTEYCKDGSCEPSQCSNITCGTGRVCNPETGKCIDDPCLYITCPSSEVCRNGNCFSPPSTEEEVPGEGVTEGVEEGVTEASEEAVTEATNDGGNTEAGNDTNNTKEDNSSADKTGGEATGDKGPGELPPPPDGGCGCSQNPAPTWPIFFGLFALLALTFGRRRRTE